MKDWKKLIVTSLAVIGAGVVATVAAVIIISYEEELKKSISIS